MCVSPLPFYPFVDLQPVLGTAMVFLHLWWIPCWDGDSQSASASGTRMGMGALKCLS